MNDTNTIPNTSGGKEVFFHLLGFFTLAISANSLGMLIFQVINKYFSPEVVASIFSYNTQALRWALSALIVVAPVYFFTTRYTVAATTAGNFKTDSRLKRALTYIVLFVACAIILGDVITLVFRFVAGETNLRFMLKVVTLLFIGGWIGWYYWESLKGARIGETSSFWHKYHAIAFIIVWIVAVVGGFILTGNPKAQQKVVRDNVRLQHLQQISSYINNDYQMSGKDNTTRRLPSSLSNVGQPGSLTGLRDPLSGAPYQYIVAGPTTYELCTEFESANELNRTNSYMETPYTTLWAHPIGRYCFTLDASKPLY